MLPILEEILYSPLVKNMQVFSKYFITKNHQIRGVKGYIPWLYVMCSVADPVPVFLVTRIRYFPDPDPQKTPVIQIIFSL